MEEGRRRGFQFLIGSLEAVEERGVVGEYLFQFLIGSLEALPLVGLLAIKLKFQFLIGSLEAGKLHYEDIPELGFNSS